VRELDAPTLMIATCRRFQALPPHRRRLVCEAAVLLASILVGLRILPFLRLRRLVDRCAALGSATNGTVSDTVLRRAAVNSVEWAIGAVAARMRASCLARALAAAAMLRRRGVRCDLRLGVRPATSAAIEAHAWVECDDGLVVGLAADQAEYKVLEAARS
jgi:hypothetical protein